MTTQAISVPEISCETCKNAIEGALTPLDGVRAAVVDIAAKRVSVDYDETTIGHGQLVAAIQEQGYTVAGES